MTITKRHRRALVDADAGWNITAIYDEGADLRERLVNAGLLGADGKLTEAGTAAPHDRALQIVEDAIAHKVLPHTADRRTR